MIQQLIEEHIGLVVDLHKKVLGHTLNSQIGSWFLRKLYKATGDCLDNGFCYVFIQGGQVVGFVSFCFDHRLLEKEIMTQLSLREKFTIVWFLLARPWLWPAFVRQQYFARYLKKNFSQPYVSILTLGVSPDIQGQGMGRQLVDKVKEVVRSKNAEELFVDTEQDNVKATAFYRKNGFQQVAVMCGNIVLKYRI